MAASRAGKRLEKELQDLLKNPEFPVQVQPGPEFRWFVTIRGAPHTLYQGEAFTLQFTFNDQYPLEAPCVVFLPPAPVHPHIYSNGHICLSILYDGWSPALRVNAVCMSILSMLSSCTTKEKPKDNDMYVRTAGPDPRKTHWAFHDDTV